MRKIGIIMREIASRLRCKPYTDSRNIVIVISVIIVLSSNKVNNHGKQRHDGLKILGAPQNHRTDKQTQLPAPRFCNYKRKLIIKRGAPQGALTQPKAHPKSTAGLFYCEHPTITEPAKRRNCLPIDFASMSVTSTIKGAHHKGR